MPTTEESAPAAESTSDGGERGHTRRRLPCREDTRCAAEVMPLVLLIGGARSGKSELALRLAREQTAPVVFVATGEARDSEMAARIDEHRRGRPPSWQTIQEPLRLY